MKYAKFISETEISYPNASDFPGIINPLANDALMRDNGYYPLIGEPESREGFTAVPAHFEFVSKTKIVERSRQVEITETDDNGECGRHTGWEKYMDTIDDSCIQITEWDYSPIETPETPPAERIYTKLQIRRACRKLGLETLLDSLLESNPQIKNDWQDAQEINLADPVLMDAVNNGIIDASIIEQIAENI